MSFSNVAHDPSGPPGHLPSFAGEESMSATGVARSQQRRAGTAQTTHRFSLARLSSKRRSSAQSFLATG
jgi:hypothetical protein